MWQRKYDCNLSLSLSVWWELPLCLPLNSMRTFLALSKQTLPRSLNWTRISLSHSKAPSIRNIWQQREQHWNIELCLEKKLKVDEATRNAGWEERMIIWSCGGYGRKVWWQITLNSSDTLMSKVCIQLLLRPEHPVPYHFSSIQNVSSSVSWLTQPTVTHLPLLSPVLSETGVRVRCWVEGPVCQTLS